MHEKIGKKGVLGLFLENAELKFMRMWYAGGAKSTLDVIALAAAVRCQNIFCKLPVWEMRTSINMHRASNALFFLLRYLFRLAKS